MDRFLVFDLGASSGRAIVGVFGEGRISFEEIHRFDNRPVYAAGELYWDILRLYSEIKAGIEICTKKYGQVHSLAIDTWGCDFGLIDKNGRLIGNPVHYRDRKRYERSKMLHEMLPEKELFKLSGGPQDRIMGIYQLFSLKYENAVEYKNAHKFLMIPDILNYFLTGEIVNEFTNATMSLMCNLNTRQWEKKIMSTLGFPEEIFSDLREPGVTIGNLSKVVCEELCIKAIPVIIPPTHDTASAVAGIPVVDNNKPWAFIILGTWCIGGIETSVPIINEKVLAFGFGNEGGVEGKNMLLKNTTGMWIMQQCREYWTKSAQKDISWNEINVAANMAQPLEAYIDVDDECFGKVQPEMPNIIVQYCKDSGQEAPATIGEIARCINESLALKFRHNLTMLQELSGKKLEIIHLVGGGIKNKLLCQGIADALAIPVVAGPTETTSVGNLILQLKAGGFIKNVQEGRKLCRDSFAISEYQPCNTDMWDKKYLKYSKLIKNNEF
jgi:rhamnulokinase